MSAIAAAVISGIVAIGSQLISGVAQSKAIDASQEEARSLSERQIAEDAATRKSNNRLSRQQLRQNQKQFDASLGFEREKLGVSRDLNARKSFRDQYSQLTQILDKNEELKSMYVNRLASLRG